MPTLPELRNTLQSHINKKVVNTAKIVKLSNNITDLTVKITNNTTMVNNLITSKIALTDQDTLIDADINATIDEIVAHPDYTK
jgi:hypothetical protein